MFEFLTSTDEDAIAILKNDHDKVKDLFSRFEKAESLAEKKKIAARAIMELKIHAAIEEEIFYPTVRKEVDFSIMNEADEEHHVAKLLIAELEEMDPTDDHFSAKFTVLAENVRHHIREEEGEMMPQARSADIDFVELGQELLKRKEELQEDGVPVSLEEKMIVRFGASADSPARAAKGKTMQNRSGKKTSERTSYSSSSKPNRTSKSKKTASRKR